MKAHYVTVGGFRGAGQTPALCRSVDPDRCLRVLGLEGGRSLSPKVLCVYRKQLEEADVLVINKVDAFDAARVSMLRDALARAYPSARVLEVSAKTGTGLGAWIDSL